MSSLDIACAIRKPKRSLKGSKLEQEKEGIVAAKTKNQSIFLCFFFSPFLPFFPRMASPSPAERVAEALVPDRAEHEVRVGNREKENGRR